MRAGSRRPRATSSSSRGRAPVAPRSAASTLTASERRVAQLAASGLTNKEAAQALFVTLKTVETHLASVYRKLGIRSRTQLPAALAGLPTA